MPPLCCILSARYSPLQARGCNPWCVNVVVYCDYNAAVQVRAPVLQSAQVLQHVPPLIT